MRTTSIGGPQQSLVSFFLWLHEILGCGKTVSYFVPLLLSRTLLLDANQVGGHKVGSSLVFILTLMRGKKQIFESLLRSFVRRFFGRIGEVRARRQLMQFISDCEGNSTPNSLN